jgi:hypothetical protein
MKSKFFVDEQDQDQDEIPELVEEIENAEPVVVETPVTAIEERSIAKQLEGNPHPFDAASVRVLKCLAERNIAADFGDSGWARGCNWKTYMRSV